MQEELKYQSGQISSLTATVESNGSRIDTLTGRGQKWLTGGSEKLDEGRNALAPKGLAGQLWSAFAS